MKEYGAAAARVSAAAHAAEESPYQACAYESDGRRCEYPGTQRAKRSGAWMCKAHIDCFDPIMGADIVFESVGYRRKWMQDRDEFRKRKQAEAEAWCKANGLDTVEKMREYVRNNTRRFVQDHLSS